jgi:predicted nucleic acid-binding protein
MISTFTAFFDANVFFGPRLRSLILELAQTKTFRARWSEEVHREWIDAVLKKRPNVSQASLQKTRQDMDNAVLDCLVTHFHQFIPALKLPDPDDRHVLAAAIVGRANVIVTFDLGHFPAAELTPYGIHPKHPDEFLLDLESISPTLFVEAVAHDWKHYVRSPEPLDEYLRRITKSGVPKTAAHLAARRVLIEAVPNHGP